MKPVILTPRQWKKIRAVMQEEYPRTVFMLRGKMKQVLGFTVREHGAWINGEHEFQIHLDFFSENKRTMFLLKYGEFLNGQ